MTFQKRPSCPCQAEKLIRFLFPGASIQLLYKEKVFNLLEHFGITGTFLLLGRKWHLVSCCPLHAHGDTYKSKRKELQTETQALL